MKGTSETHMENKNDMTTQKTHPNAFQRFTTNVKVFLIGLGIGTVATMLFAPRKGEETRALIGDAVDERISTGRQAALEVIEQFEGEIPELRKRVDKALKQGVKESRKAAKNVEKQIQKETAELRKRVKANGH